MAKGNSWTSHTRVTASMSASCGCLVSGSCNERNDGVRNDVRVLFRLHDDSLTFYIEKEDAADLVLRYQSAELLVTSPGPRCELPRHIEAELTLEARAYAPCRYQGHCPKEFEVTLDEVDEQGLHIVVHNEGDEAPATGKYVCLQRVYRVA